MAAFASILDLKLGGFDVDAWDWTELHTLLERASDEIRAEGGQTIDQATTTDVIQGNWTARLNLPQRPVTSVASVLVNGVAQAAASWQLQKSTGTLVRRDTSTMWAVPPSQQYTIGTWGGPDVDVEVTYTHGMAVPSWATTLTVDMVRRALSPEAGPDIRQETIADYSVTYLASRIKVTDSERRMIRRRVAGTVMAGR